MQSMFPKKELLDVFLAIEKFEVRNLICYIYDTYQCSLLSYCAYPEDFCFRPLSETKYDQSQESEECPQDCLFIYTYDNFSKFSKYN